jgi:hypothetical protein
MNTKTKSNEPNKNGESDSKAIDSEFKEILREILTVKPIENSKLKLKNAKQKPPRKVA